MVVWFRQVLIAHERLASENTQQWLITWRFALGLGWPHSGDVERINCEINFRFGDSSVFRLNFMQDMSLVFGLRLFIWSLFNYPWFTNFHGIFEIGMICYFAVVDWIWISKAKKSFSAHLIRSLYFEVNIIGYHSKRTCEIFRQLCSARKC